MKKHKQEGTGGHSPVTKVLRLRRRLISTDKASRKPLSSILNTILIALAVIQLSELGQTSAYDPLDPPILSIYSSQSATKPAIFLQNTFINERSSLRFQGSITQVLKPGDCFKIQYQPYERSKNAYQIQTSSSPGLPDFYAPFAKNDMESQPLTYSMDAASSANYKVKDGFNDASGETLIVEVVTGNQIDIDFTVESMMNPFSKLKTTGLSNRFNVKHLTACDEGQPSHIENCDTEAKTNCETINNADGANVAAPTFTGPSEAQLGAIVPTISSNILGTTDGNIDFEIETGKYWPVYGGKLTFTLPLWYGDDSVAVFNSNTDCFEVREDGTLILGTPVTDTIPATGQTLSSSTVLILYYKVQPKVTIRCTNYNNPVYRKEYKGFRITLTDQEDIPNTIGITSEFSLPKDDTMLAVDMDPNEIKFKFLIQSSNQWASTDLPVPIQQQVGLQISFNMPIPSEKDADQGCWLKVTFPKEMPLPPTGQDEELIYQSVQNNMMSAAPTETGGVCSSNLLADQIENSFQDYNGPKDKAGNNNYIVFNGCKCKSGNGLPNIVKIINFQSPEAVKDTQKIKIELYKEQTSSIDQTYDNLILKSERSITADFFRSGQITDGKFSSVLPFIQRSPWHSIQFKIENSLPMSTNDFGNRIVVVMPSEMTKDPNQAPIINSMDQILDDVAISRIETDDDYSGCSTRVCYQITHSSTSTIPGNSVIKFNIKGTTNQLSVRDAGMFTIQTQLLDKAEQKYYDINRGQFESGFETEPGGITLPSGQRLQASSYSTYEEDVKYTFSFSQPDYVPLAGFLKVIFPEGVSITSNPYTALECVGCENYKAWGPTQSDGYGEETVDGQKQNFVKFKAVQQVDGDAENYFKLTFGGVKNPISFEATGVFRMKTFDASNPPNMIAEGPIDIIRMTEMSKFTEMSINIENPTNGALSKYTITFKAKTRLVDGDIFNLILPQTIGSPKEPICKEEKCLDTVSCTSERGKLIATFGIQQADCLVDDAEISFSVEGMTNAASLVKSEAIQAFWTSKSYMKVCEYEGEGDPKTFHIQNTLAGSIEEVSISQASKDYAVNNQYTVRFTPKNPIPKLGWVALVYPINVKIIDGDVTSLDDFINGRGSIPGVELYSSNSYSGDKYAFMDEDKRTIYFHSSFMEQDSYTSEVAISMQLTNPQTNFFKDTNTMTPEEKEKYDYDMSFHISTYTIDTINDFPEIESSDFDQTKIDDMVSKVKTNPEQYLFAIDVYPSNDIRPLLKCVAPCLTCLNAVPDYCTSCWGQFAGEDASGVPQANLKYFLQKKEGAQTCQESCDDKYTTNGKEINPSSSTEKYYECQECDLFCEKCKGQGLADPVSGEIDYGNPGDKKRCVTCSPIFPYLVPSEEKCYSQCNAGYYEKVSKVFEPNAPPAECGLCDKSEEVRCETCMACEESNPKCKFQEFGIEAGAKFCTSCVQDGFTPEDLEDIGELKLYFEQQRSMVDKNQYSVTGEEEENIVAAFEELTMVEFLATKIETEDGIVAGTGFKKSDLHPITSETTYKEYYESIYSSYKFPKKSLHENECLAKCPDTFASVNGVCLKCKSPCELCKKEVTRCTKCLQNQPLKYVFGSACYEECPKGTIADEENKKCLGCVPGGCIDCEREDQEICLECDIGLLLHEKKCVGQCPKGYRASFDGKKCQPKNDNPVFWMPLSILTLFAFCVAVGGKYSSKNVSGQHRTILSFYCLLGCIDTLAMFTLLVCALIDGADSLQNSLVQIIIPGAAILINYFINYLYKVLWWEIDPPKPEFDEKLTIEEVRLINKCDENFDKWNTKYEDLGNKIANFTFFWSHKMFFMPYTHFFGQLHFTLRTQDYMARWVWEDKECMRFTQKHPDYSVEILKGEKANRKVQNKEGKFLYKGVLLPAQKERYSKVMLQKFVQRQKESEVEGEGDPALKAILSSEKLKDGNESPDIQKEGGMALAENHEAEWHPYFDVQHPHMTPRKTWDMIPDNRVISTFRKQIVFDYIMRLVLIGGGAYILLPFLMDEVTVAQVHIAALECIILSVIMIMLQAHILYSWEEQRLPFKMRDNRANYLFKRAKAANRARQDWTEKDDFMPYWNKYMHFYKFNEIFLDNKLEELLNIFGRRNAISCIEFDTGTDLVEDYRRTKSWPLSPRGEAEYERLRAEFDAQLVNLKLQNNVYAEAYGLDNEPTLMFGNDLARDFSDFGAQVFSFDVMEALDRKGGNLLTPGIENQIERRKTKIKKRGRKNKYYRQIDQEDDEEAKQISDDSENDGLDQVKEADDEDDEDEIRRKREEEQQEQRRIQEKRQREAEERRRKEEEEQRKNREKQAEYDRKIAEGEKMKAEQERLAKQRKDEKERKEKEEAAKKAAQQEANQEKLKAAKGPQEKEANFSENQVDDKAQKKMAVKSKSGAIEVPPNAESRTFNECDIIGDLDRDEKGNVIANEPDPKTQSQKDNKGRPTNERGYLTDPKTGDIVNNLDGKKMFAKSEMDDKGEVPAPFNVEKHNFNPHLTRGDFDYDRNGKPIVKKNGKGQYVDKKGNVVSSRGYRIDEHGNMVDNKGRMKFHHSQMTDEGDLPKLFNYNGRRFDITETMGQVEKDADGEIVANTDAQGRLIDNLGRPINRKGYLIDEAGNVIDKDNRPIFFKDQLKDDEIPKILPFTKFNLKNVLGDFEMDPLGNPILDKDGKGNKVDRQGRRVNTKGYLIDNEGNVINKNNKQVFKKEMLDHEDDIPKVFRTGLLKSDTASSLSRLMSEIERNQPSEFDQEERKIQDEIEKQMQRPPRANSGNTSVDSMMEDTPANYNMQNQRFDPEGEDMEDGEGEGMDEDDDEYGSQYDQMGVTGMTGKGDYNLAKKKKKKKKKKRKKPTEFEDPSLREHLMAGAYGGVAKKKPKRAGVKYTTDLDAGLRDIATPASGFVRDPSRRRMMGNASQSGFEGHGGESSRGRKHYGRNRSSVGRSDMGSQIGSRIGSKKGGMQQQESTSKLLDPQQREAQLKKQQMDEIKRKQIAKAKQQKAAGKIGKISKDADFEKMFGKDIDEFLEDSEWDIESIDKMSHFSKGSKNTIRSASQAGKLKGLEKLYLNRMDHSQQNQAPTGVGAGSTTGAIAGKGKFRGDGEDEKRKQAWDGKSSTSKPGAQKK